MLKKILLKRILLCILVVILLLSGSVAGASDSPFLTAEAAVLLDWNSGRVLYVKNPYLPKPMASITKIMTAVIALETADLRDIVVTSSRAATTAGSSIWLEEGEKKTLEELLYGLMLRSGNDAAVAIAEHVAGDVESFANLMTGRARELGARNTSFRNPHGLHHENHYTTAHDFALIASHAMGLSRFREIISAEHVIISWPGHPWERHLYNQNKLLEIYPDAEGIKTGWTTPAGRCFVGAAAKDGRRLIAVVLNAPGMWEDTVKLLDHGFTNYLYQPVIYEGQYLKTVSVVNSTAQRVQIISGKTFKYPLAEGEEQRISYRFNINNPLYAPLKKGETVGEMEIYFEQELVGMVDLLAAADISKLTIWQRLKQFAGRGI